MKPSINLTAAEDDPQWLANRAALVLRLRRVEGQLRGLQAMIERELSCAHLSSADAKTRLSYVTELLSKYG